MAHMTRVLAADCSCAAALMGHGAHAQITTGTIYGSGYGLSPGQRD